MWWCYQWVDTCSSVLKYLKGVYLGPLLIIIYTSEVFDLLKNKMFAYADESTILVVFSKHADRPIVTAILKRDLIWIRKWCHHWSMLLNLSQTITLVGSRSRSFDTPHSKFASSGVLIRVSKNHDTHGVRFECKFTFKAHICSILSLPENLYLKVDEERFLMTLLCRHYSFVLLYGLQLLLSPSASWAPSSTWSIPHVVVESGLYGGFKGAINRWLLSWVFFFLFSVVWVLVGFLQ